ncbi:MAG: Aspartate carbamoyltransferase, partial [uncultured Gemmatimonadaceae bacterium]
DRAAREGPPRARAALRRADQPGPRHRRAVQGDLRTRDQEGAGAARRDRRQPLLRGVDPHADLVRVRREAPLRRHGERGVVGVERVEGRDARGHGAEPRGDADRHGRHPPRVERRGPLPRRADRVERDQRGRRHARAPHPGAPRPADAARPLQDARRAARLHLRGRAALAGRPVEHLGAPEARRRGRGVRPAVAAAGRDRGARRDRVRPHRRGDRVGGGAQRAAPAARADAGRLHPVAARVQPRVRHHARAARAGAARRSHPPPRADEPRRRDRLRRRGWAALRDPRPSDERRRRAHGGALPARRRPPRARRRREGGGGPM